jgi:8-oxo-dGTP pyrophosphatase MutT (NUDIX family)
MERQPERHLVTARCYLLIVKGDRVLFTLRAARLPGGARWQLPGGHLESGESLLDCAVREAREEVGVVLTADNLDLVHTSHVLTAPRSHVGCYFKATTWSGEPANREPDFCDDLAFAPLDNPPRPLVRSIAQAIGRIRKGEPFGVTGTAPATGTTPA